MAVSQSVEPEACSSSAQSSTESGVPDGDGTADGGAAEEGEGEGAVERAGRTGEFEHAASPRAVIPAAPRRNERRVSVSRGRASLSSGSGTDTSCIVAGASTTMLPGPHRGEDRVRCGRPPVRDRSPRAYGAGPWAGASTAERRRPRGRA